MKNFDLLINHAVGSVREAQSIADKNMGLTSIKPRQNLDKTSTKPCVLSRIVSMKAGKRLDNGSMMARIWKYAAMLLFVLTLGVGQMWAYNIIRNAELAGSSGDWSNSDNMTQVGSSAVYYKTYSSPKATTDLCFRIGSSGWTTEKNADGIDNLNSNIVMVSNGDGDKNIKFQIPTSVPVTIYYNSSTKKIWIKVESYKTDVLDGKAMFYYGFTKDWSQEFAHFYDNGTRKFGSYAATSYADGSAKLAIGLYNVNGSTNYSASNSDSWAGVTHSGMAGGDQIQTYNDGSNKCYHNAADQFSFGTTAKTIVVGQTIASFPTISFTSKQSGADADLSLEGYYYSTATSGETWTTFTPGTTESSLAAGTYYIKAIATDGAIYMASSNYITLTVNSAPVLGVANATSVSNNSATFNATATLNSNTTTSYGFKYGAGSSYDTQAELISGGTSASTSGVLDGTSFSKSVTGLSASTTYYYISFAVVNGTTYYSSSVKSFTTTAAATYSLIVSAGTGISAVTGSTDNISANQSIDITATVATGYSWNTWTKAGAGTLSTFTAGTKNQTVKVGTAGNITLTASATENMSTLSTSNHFDVGTPGYAIPTKSVSSIGISTTATLTAATPSTGYTFTGWTLSNNIVVTSGDKDTDLSITVRTNGNGAAATAQANYEEDLSTLYVIKGGERITGDTGDWTTEIAFTKKSGESTGSIAYAEIPITIAVGEGADTKYNFKVVKDGSTWYGLNGSGDYWYNSSTGEQTLGTSNQNIQLRANVVGTYIAKIDFSTPASPKITITWPVALSIYRSNPNDATNVGDHQWATHVGNNYTWALDLEANTTYEFKINQEGTYYGHNTQIEGTFSGREFATGTSDTKLKTKSAGRFNFTWDGSAHTMTLQYPKSAAIGASPTSVYSGGTTTLTGYASELGSGSHAITYEFFKGTTLTDAYKIYTTSNTVDATYQQVSYDATVNFEGNATSQVYTVRIKEGGSVLATNTVTVYRKWDIYVHDVASWGGMYNHMWGNGQTTWPGNECSLYNGSTSWYTVTIDAYYPRFQLNCNECTNHKRTLSGDDAYTPNISTFTPGSYWYTNFSSHGKDGNDYYTLSSITLSDPTVTLSASITNCKDITLTGTVTNCGGDGSFASDMKEVYFQIAGTKNSPTTTSTTDGTFTKTISNATAGTTNTLQAYAVNVHGTGSSSTLHYTNVTLDRQSGTTGTTAVTAVENMAMPAGATAPGRTGYTFGGYYESENGEDKQYYNASMGSANNWDQTSKDKTIYAKWTANTWYVRFNRNGGTTGSDMSNESFTYDAEAKALTTNTYTRTGYDFSGWATSAERANAGTVDYEDKATVRNLTATAGGIIDLYAVWTAKTYTVSFDVNSGTASTPDNINVTFGSAYGTLPSGMTHASKTFVGWYTNPDDGEGDLITAETIVSIAEDHTLYAHYESVYSVNVEYKCGDATVYPATSVNASSTTLAPTITAPEIFGYTFSGWTESGSSYVTFANASSATTTITTTGAATVVANYNVVPTVYFKNNLGWDSVFVSFDITWETVGGKQVPSNKNKPYYRMTQMGTTDVYYCEIPSTYTASNYAGWAWNIAFDNTNYGSTGSTTHSGTWDEFYGGEFVGRGDFDPKTTLYIPYNGDTETRNTAKFYKTGCWMKYNSTESGYQVNMNKNVTGASADSCTVPLTAVNAGGYEFSAKINLKRADYSYGFKLYKIYEKNTTDLWYTNTGSITAETESLPWNFWAGSSVTSTSQRCSLHTEALGDYTITVSFATGKPMVDVIYPTSVGDWRLVYNDRVAWSGDAHDASWHLYSRVIKAEANAVDTISFYVSKAENASASIAIEKCTDINASTGAETWEKQGDNIALSSITETGIYNFKVTQNGSKVASAEYLGSYSGNFYIRTDAADGGWSNYKNSGKNLMTYSEYAEENSGFTHYFMRYVTQGTNIKFCVANDYSECLTEYCISDTYTNEYIDAYGNVRFMWNDSSNAVSRAYISGSTNISDRFLVLEGDAKMFNESGTPLTTGNGRVSGLNEYEMNFRDDQNWIYEATVQAQPGARVKLTARYNNKIQYFYGDEGTTAADSVQLLGGNEESTHQYKIRVVYDFKTNRLIKAFVPDGEIDEELSIEADLMIIREHQGDAQQIQFNEEGKLTDVKSVYGAMRFNKYTVNGKSKEAGHAATGASRYERDLFYISFPFNVKLSDAFGFGTYGKHWIIEYYDGKGRAKNGFWADSDSNWKFVTPAQRSNFTMNAFEGYILALDLDEMTESSSVWNNGVEDVYVYFPSETEVENIYATEKTVTIDQTGYQCTIGSRFEGGEDRRVKDSYWHMIGAPSFANYSSAVKTSKSDGSAIDWSDSDGVIDWTSPSLPYLYVWDPEDNSLSVTRSSGNFTFKAMYSYMVQYAGTSIYWSSVNAVVPSPVAPRKADNAPTDVEFRLELQQGEEKSDQAFIKLSYDDNVTTGFDFNYDLSKEFNKNKANVYTMITSTIDNEVSVTESAGNVLPMTEQTTVVPVGVKIAANSDYTFSIPEGTEGIGVTLIDKERGIRTNLSALDYTVSLEAGTYDDRFLLQISPIHTVPTEVEVSEIGDQTSDVRKLLIDGLMYIVRDGKMYDARGARVE